MISSNPLGCPTRTVQKFHRKVLRQISPKFSTSLSTSRPRVGIQGCSCYWRCLQSSARKPWMLHARSNRLSVWTITPQRPSPYGWATRISGTKVTSINCRIPRFAKSKSVEVFWRRLGGDLGGRIEMRRRCGWWKQQSEWFGRECFCPPRIKCGWTSVSHSNDYWHRWWGWSWGVKGTDTVGLCTEEEYVIWRLFRLQFGCSQTVRQRCGPVGLFGMWDMLECQWDYTDQGEKDRYHWRCEIEWRLYVVYNGGVASSWTASCIRKSWVGRRVSYMAVWVYQYTEDVPQLMEMGGVIAVASWYGHIDVVSSLINANSNAPSARTCTSSSLTLWRHRLSVVGTFGNSILPSWRGWCTKGVIVEIQSGAEPCCSRWLTEWLRVNRVVTSTAGSQEGRSWVGQIGSRAGVLSNDNMEAVVTRFGTPERCFRCTSLWEANPTCMHGGTRV